MARSKTVKVYEVLHGGKGSGPAGDGTYIYRTGEKCTAEDFARTHTCYGGPATVQETDAPRHLAQRWGVV